jgi:Flp pilus assembly protein TadG
MRSNAPKMNPMRRFVSRLRRDEAGAVLVEATVALSIIFVFVLGSIDFLTALYEWNAASKAIAMGARIAAVSSPVASDLSSITGLEGGATPGDPMPDFGTYTCTGDGNCSVGAFNAAAFNTIFYGRGSGACNDAVGAYYNGMCDQLGPPVLKPENVVISYAYSGLGYAGRPGGPVPTITVSLQNMTFQLFFLGGLLGLNNIPMPSMATSITGEDLSSNAP